MTEGKRPIGDVIGALAGGVLIGAACWLVTEPTVPLGWLGEWVWNRSPNWPPTGRWIMLISGALPFCVVGLVGYRLLLRVGEVWIMLLLPALLAAGAVWQAAVVHLPEPPWGMERWPIVILAPATSGYLGVARTIAEPHEFLRNYASWIAQQDNFHLGTHPPGLFLLHYWALRQSKNPPLSKWLSASIPDRFRVGIKGMLTRPRPPALASQEEENLLWMLAGGTWLAGLLAAIPLYWLIRLGGSPAAGWTGACVWLTTPAPILFLPVGDCLFPLLAVLVIALAGWSTTRWRLPLAVLAGGVWWSGQFLSLAFLAILPIVAAEMLLLPCRPSARPRWFMVSRLGGFLLGAGMGFGGIWFTTGFDAWRVAQINLAKHAGFYAAMPRSYRVWVVLDLVEFVVVSSPLIVVWLIEGMRPKLAWGPLAIVLLGWLGTLALLDLSGRNLSEVARLWIFLTPIAGLSAAWRGAGRPPPPWRWLWDMILMMLLASLLQARVEPLLPVGLSALPRGS